MNQRQRVYNSPGQFSLFRFLYACLITAILNGNVLAEDSEPGLTQRLKERLSAAEYDARFAAAAAGLKDAEKFALTEQPAVGLEIKSVHPDSPAYKLGIRKGDVATRLNGVTLWSTHAFRYEARRSLEFYSTTSTKFKTVKLPEGLIGIDTVEVWQPEWIYLRGKSHRPEWDPEAFVGITMAAEDPKLAETAWCRAFDKGYKPDVYSAAAGLEIAYARSDAQLASEFLNDLKKFEADNGDIINPLLLYRVAIANGQLQEMLRIVEKYPNVLPMISSDIQRLIELQNSRSKEENAKPMPHVLADSFLRDDQTPRLVGHWIEDVKTFLPALQKKHSVTLLADPRQQDAIMFSPPEPTPNVDLSIKFSWSPQTKAKGEFIKRIEVSLVDNTSPVFGFDVDDPRPGLMSFAITQQTVEADPPGKTRFENRVRLEHFPLQEPFQYFDRSVKVGSQATHQVHFIKTGGQGEMLVDGRRLICLPLDVPSQQLELRVRIAASEAVLHDLRFDELVEDARK